MKTVVTNNTSRALTLVELLISIFVIVVMAGLLLPALKRPPPAKRVNCLSNLKQVGLAFRLWSGDHGEHFPWAVPTAEGGTMEYVASPEVIRHFAILTNDLSSPRVLSCLADEKVSREANWTNFQNSNLSYFVGLEADESKPQSILTGDRNIFGGVIDSNGIVNFGSNSLPRWGTDIHKGAGNIGLGDGSAQQVNPQTMRKQIEAALLATNVAALRFAIPNPDSK